MKKINYIILLVLGICFFPSCADYLDKEPDTELTLPMVFEDKVRMEGWLANVYSAIPDPVMGYIDGEGWDVFGDEFTPSERLRQFGYQCIPFILGEWSTSSGWKGDYWAKLPRRIRNAYIFIENVKPLPDQKVSAQEVEYMKAECRFLIAYYYYLLVNTYGAIPFQPDYIAPSDFKLEDLMVGQTPYDEVIDWIDKELLTASKILPSKYSETNKYGRATSVMCLAVRARMLLFAAGDLVNGNPDYAEFTNNEGELIFNPDKSKQPARWAKATEACRELIQTATEAGHELYIERNEDGSIDPFSSYQNLFLTEYAKGNKEILFARPAINSYEFEKLATPRGSAGNGNFGVTQRLVDAFFMQDGLPIDKSPAYSEKGFSTQKETRTTHWDGCKEPNLITDLGTFNMYCKREPRFYATVYYNGEWYPNDKRNLSFYLNTSDNDNTHDSPQNGYLIRKKTSPKSNQVSGYRPYRPGIIYRLGEAYLNYAEALNESNPGNTDILVYLNKIRERAGIRTYTTGATDANGIHVDLSNQAEMRELIRHERNVELCCEGIRYDDLRRWKEAENLLNGDFYGMKFTGTIKSDDPTNPAAFFVRTAYQTRAYKKQFYWFPIYQGIIDVNSNLVQTPLWK